MADTWYIDAGGNVEGPFSAAELSTRAAAGRLKPTDGASRDGAKWVPASTVPGLTFPKPARPLVETVVSRSVNLSASAVLPDEIGGGPRTVPVVTVRGYQLLDTLGAGACGVVYKARQEKLNRVVALKTVLMPDKASNDLIERFKQEAVSLARLQHPNIVAVYDGGPCDTPPGQAFFAMELLDGEDLAARLDRDGPLDERTAWLLARQTAAALAHAAKNGVTHRDIKPANLFLVTAPTGFPLPPGVPMVKVTDFGLALSRAPGEGDQRQTAAGVMLGTPVYMAPEQFAGSDVDARADIYSLGATVYHCLAGRVPFDGRTVFEVMMKKATPAARLQPPVSDESAALVASMMAIDATQRPRDYADLIARIDELPCMDGGIFGQSGRIVIAPPEKPLAAAPAPAPVAKPQAARSRRKLYALALVALVGVALGVLAWRGAFNRQHTYTLGTAEALFDGHSVYGWNGAGVTVESDDEKPVLAFEGTATRALPAVENARVVIGLDRHKAASVEVTIAATDSARWVVRIDANGAALGKHAKNGAFEPAAPPLPLPKPKPNQPPYLELRYEVAGGGVAAWYDNQPLGRSRADGARATEVRITATGGPIRIESAECAELVKVK
jgi:hypothetical protein